MASASANFCDFEAFLFLFGRTKQAQIFLETTLENINFHLRAFCLNELFVIIRFIIAEKIGSKIGS